MGIKCTERTGSTIAKDIVKRHLMVYYYNGSYVPSPVNYKRYNQLRKRSLTSMGWKYHV